MIRQWCAVLFCILVSPCSAEVDFEKQAPGYILETKKIPIPGYPDAFNPSLIRWEGRLLLSFRNVANPKDSYNSSELGLIWLDEHFNPVSAPQILQLNEGGPESPHRAEDGRLIAVNDRLYMIYSDNQDPVITKSGFRVHVAELMNEDGQFHIIAKDCLKSFEGNDPNLREKNWTPFDYHGNLLLSYSLSPHMVLRPILGSGGCDTVANTKQTLDWRWGELRGGTQTLWVEGRYLTFFHTAVRMISKYSDGKEMLYYFMGACTFDEDPPFAMQSISPEPIIGGDFFTGPYYKPYWGSWRGTFPGGFVIDDEYIYVVYGKQNHEVWMVKLDKTGLLQSLVLVGQ